MVKTQMYRNKIAEWMQEVLAVTGWSAEEWARRAGTAATNVTRLVYGAVEKGHTPNADTLAKLAAVAPVPLTFGDRSLTMSRVKIVRAPYLTLVLDCIRAGDRGALEKCIMQVKGETAASVGPTEPGTFAVEITENTLEAEGFRPGDIMLVEPITHRAPKNEEVVAVMDDDTKIAVYRYHPHYLIPHPASGKPTVETNKADILGVCIQLVRRL